MDQVKVRLGRVLVTRGALDSLSHDELMAALTRHCRGDWGLLDAYDERANDDALRHGGRLLSVYETAGAVRFWVITEADRSATTVLLPDEY